MRFLAGLVMTVSLLIFSAPALGAQPTDGLSYSEDTVFTVREGSVDVETTAVMRNTTAERRRGNTIYYSYFDSLIIVVPTNAQNLKIVSRGSTLSSTASEIDDDFEVRTARLPTELRSGQRRSFTITYSLPLGEIRGEGIFFSNPAFHAFPMWSFSDPGTGSLLLRIPEGARLTEFGDILRQVDDSDADGLSLEDDEPRFVEWEPRVFDVPEDIFTFVTITIDEGLDTQRFTVAGQDIELRTWPGDDEWSSFAKQTITEGLPQLEELIGLPVPDQSVLEVTESVNPYFYGYAGWYNPLDTSIEIGNELDSGVMIHELSHAWFNNGLFAERWISEGLAEEFSWQTQNALEWEAEDVPRRPLTTAKNAVPLIEWSRTSTASGVDDADFRAREAYGYSASWFVVREMVDIIGLDGVQFVLRAANDDLTSYPGENEEETTLVRDDWRRVLDLASMHATAEQEAELEALFTKYVVADRHIEMLDERRDARARYSEFISFEEDWTIPIDVRHEMVRWDFDDAVTLMGGASQVHERFREVATIAADAELELSNAAQISYERSSDDYSRALKVLADQEIAIGKVEGVRQIATRELTTEEAWGLRDVPLAPYAALAEGAFAEDDVEGIDDARQRLEAKLAEAATVGATRLVWAKVGAAALAIMVVLLTWMVIRRRRAKKQAAEVLVEPDVEVIDEHPDVEHSHAA